jgi:hypothetical protein
MKKSEAKPQTAGEKLEAPVRLTPEQLETVAAGFAVQLLPKGKGTEDPTVLTGAISTRPVLKQLF